MPRVTYKGGRLEFLDSARGVAALSVAIYHLFTPAGPFANHWLFQRVNMGTFAVMSFFFVSGFIIPVSLQRHSLGQFWIARIFRLGPAYWFAMLVIITLGSAGVCAVDPALLHIRPLAVLANLLMVAPLIHQPTVVDVSWTLGIELVFYLLCTGIKSVGMLHRRLLAAYAAVAVYLVWFFLAARGITNPMHFKASFGALLLAAFTGSVFFEVQTGALRARYAYLLMAVCLLVSFGGTYFEYLVPRPVPAGVTIPFIAVIGGWTLAGVFFGAIFAARDRKFPTPLLWLGRVSYSLYLMHDVVGLVLLDRMQSLQPYLKSCIELAVSILAADLCFRLIEKPSLLLSRGAHRNQSVVAG